MVMFFPNSITNQSFFIRSNAMPTVKYYFTLNDVKKLIADHCGYNVSNVKIFRDSSLIIAYCKNDYEACHKLTKNDDFIFEVSEIEV
jgi:hypothetical protein